jgi:hypothetical protein
MILKKDSGDEQKFCTTLMEKTVGVIGILNSDLFSDQFFLQCRKALLAKASMAIVSDVFVSIFFKISAPFLILPASANQIDNERTIFRDGFCNFAKVITCE